MKTVSYEIRLRASAGWAPISAEKMPGELGALSLSAQFLKLFQLRLRKARFTGQGVCPLVRRRPPAARQQPRDPATSARHLHEGLIGTYLVLDGVTVDTKSVLNTPCPLTRRQINTIFPSENSIVWMPPHLRWKVIPASTWSCSVLWCAPADLSRRKLPKRSATIRSGKKYPALIEANLAGLRLGYENVKMAQGDRNLALCRTPRRTGMLGAMPTLRSAASIRGSEAPSPTI